MLKLASHSLIENISKANVSIATAQKSACGSVVKRDARERAEDHKLTVPEPGSIPRYFKRSYIQLDQTEKTIIRIDDSSKHQKCTERDTTIENIRSFFEIKELTTNETYEEMNSTCALTKSLSTTTQISDPAESKSGEEQNKDDEEEEPNTYDVLAGLAEEIPGNPLTSETNDEQNSDASRVKTDPTNVQLIILSTCADQPPKRKRMMNKTKVIK